MRFDPPPYFSFVEPLPRAGLRPEHVLCKVLGISSNRQIVRITPVYPEAIGWPNSLELTVPVLPQDVFVGDIIRLDSKKKKITEYRMSM